MSFPHDHSAAFGHGGEFYDPSRFDGDATSGLCAMTKLCLCSHYGIYQTQVQRKFVGREAWPENTLDIDSIGFEMRRRIVRDRMQVTSGHNEWLPILYNYQLVKLPNYTPSANLDFGHLVFTDMSFKRFVLIMCFQPKHAANLDEWTEEQQFADYDAQTQYQANRLMCLLTCLFTPASTPEWIRATWVTPDRMSLPTKLWLFSPDGPETTETASAERKPRTFFITPEILNPTLLPGEVRLMRWTQRPSVALLRSIVVPEGTLASKPSCGYCRRVTTTVGLKKCSGCKAVYYCGDDCQAEHWKQHKSLCKAYAREQ